MSTITTFSNAKHEDLFRMGKKDLLAASKGRTARAQAAKAEIARREANAIAKGKVKPKAAKPAAKAPAKPKARVKREAVKPAPGGGGQVARSRAAKA